MRAPRGRPGMVTTPTAPLGPASSLTAIGPLARTMIWLSPAAARAEPLTSTVACAIRVPEASGRSPVGDSASAR